MKKKQARHGPAASRICMQTLHLSPCTFMHMLCVLRLIPFVHAVIEHLTINPALQTTSRSNLAPELPARAFQGEAALMEQLTNHHSCVTMFFCDIVGKLCVPLFRFLGTK